MNAGINKHGRLSDNSLNTHFQVVKTQQNGPVLLHCGSGNRIGALLALRAVWLEGKDPAAALDYGKAAGLTGLEPAVKSMLGLAESAPPPKP